MSNIRLFPADWPAQFTITAANNDSIFSGLGLGKITDCLSCTVTEERNGAFELKMVYPVTGIRYSQLALRMLIVAPPNPYDPPQAFRIYSISKEYGGKVTVKAQHISYDLSNVMMKKGEINDDSLNPTKIWNYMAANLASTFSVNTPQTDFQYTFTSDLTIDDAIDNSEGNKIHQWRLKGPKSVKGIFLGNGEDGFTKIYQVGNNNGEEPEFRFNNYQISLNRSRGENRGVTIRYGKNMKGFSQEESLEKIYTHVYPFYYASSITDYQGGYGDGTQRTYNDWACDLTQWVGSKYKTNNNPLIETGLVQDDGTPFNFRNILALDVSSLYKGEYGIDLDKIGTIMRYSQYGDIVIHLPDGKKFTIDKGDSKSFEDCYLVVWTGTNWSRQLFPGFRNGAIIDTSHYKADSWADGITITIDSMHVDYDGMALMNITVNNGSSSKYNGEQNFMYYDWQGHIIGGFSGDGETDTKNSYYYDLTKEADVSRIAAKIEKPAVRYIKENHMARFPVQLKVDLDYAEKLDIQSLYDVRLCDIVTVIYPAFNVTTLAKCTKTEFNCLTGKYSKLDFSNSWSGLAFATAQNIEGTRRSFANLSYINPALGYTKFSASM